MTHNEFRIWLLAELARSTPQKCIEWPGPRSTAGYGRAYVEGRTFQAHRLAWEITFGPIGDGLHVCHHCDNPPCCHPVHLFPGTAWDNMQDAVKKGRTSRTHNPSGEDHWTQRHLERRPRGERHGSARFTEGEIAAIRERLAGGESRRAIAHALGCHSTTIDKIANGRTWSHLARLEAEVE